MSNYAHSETKTGPGRGRRPNTSSERELNDPSYGNKLAKKAIQRMVGVKHKGIMYSPQAKSKWSIAG